MSIKSQERQIVINPTKPSNMSHNSPIREKSNKRVMGTIGLWARIVKKTCMEAEE